MIKLVQNGSEIGSGLVQEKRRTEKLKAKLPEGIKIDQFGDGRRKPYRVRYGNPRQTECFASEEERNDRAEQLALTAREQGAGVLDFDHALFRRFMDFCKRTGATLDSIEKLWKLHSASVVDAMLVEVAVKKYLALRLAEDIKEDSDTYRHMKKHLIQVLCGAVGHLPLNRVTPDMLRDALARLKDRKGKGPASSTTKRNYRKDWYTFFRRAVRERWVAENPCGVVVPPKVAKTDVKILPLRDVFMFFKEAVHSPIGNRLAIEAFAGLRVSSSARLSENEIDREEGGIVMPASKHKLDKRFFVDGFPANLLEWFDLPGQRWDIGESYYDKLKGDVFGRSRVKNPGNVLRHSFCTYHIAAFRDHNKTATLLTHRNATMLYLHYRGRGVSQKVGAAYFEITPETVKLSWEEFAEMNGLKPDGTAAPAATVPALATDDSDILEDRP
jgi:site-specific recombinase XerD